MARFEYAPHGRTFVTSDTHFGQADAHELFDRPFKDVSAMNTALIEHCNAVMGEDDVLYHLGDFVGDLSDNQAKIRVAQEVRSQLNVGRIILVRGNHDPNKRKYKRIFDDVHDLLSPRGWSGGDHRIVLSHYPLRSWQGNRAGSLHLYGHVHGRLEELGRSCDVGVDCWNHAPVEIDRVFDLLAQRQITALPARRFRRQPVRESE
ncbi:MAG: metallophosphoesterase [Phycisphaerales bacterium]|nr:metallophosphoesterase [Phycisphaerales bacterium]